MSFLTPSNRTVALMPFIQSDLGLSNLIATIGRINDVRAQQSVAPAWLLGQVKEFSDSLDSYITAGGEPSEMLWTIHFCKSLVTATTELLVASGDYETMKEVVVYVAAITEALGHTSFSDTLDCHWHGFIIRQVCTNLFGEV